MRHIVILFLTIWLILLGCSEEAADIGTTSLVTPGKNLDIGNDQTSGDIFAVFSLASISGVEKIEVMITPTDGFTSVADINVSDVSDNARQSIAINGKIYKLRLRSGLKDITGGAVTNKAYKLVFLITQNGVTSLNQSVGSVTLSDRHVLEGKFSGTWNDNIYTDFGISAVLTSTNNRLDGAFFYSPNFAPCCGGSDDGTIRMTIGSGGVLSNFFYNQQLDLFMGGACPGSYEGEGSIDDIITLNIDFEGNDCEGDHTGGRICLTRIE